MKKLITILLAVLLLCAMSVSAFAYEDINAVPAASAIESEKSLFGDDTVDVYYAGETRSTHLPTQYWNLATQNYTADLQVVGKSWLYTNYYFHPNGDGRIYVDYDVTADTRTTSLYIGLYDLTKDKLVVEFTPIEVRTTGKTGAMYFYNLTQSHNYAVCFRAHPASLNGSAIIKH